MKKTDIIQQKVIDMNKHRSNQSGRQEKEKITYAYIYIYIYTTNT